MTFGQHFSHSSNIELGENIAGYTLSSQDGGGGLGIMIHEQLEEASEL
jgi:hypothetical protein